MRPAHVRAAVSTLAIVLGLAAPAAAGSRTIVLQAGGTADADLRVKIDASVLKLANATDDQISPGDISFNDAAAAVGCEPDQPACRDEVLGMLTVDEVVYTVVTAKPGGVVIQVFRVRKGSTRNAKMWLPSDASTERLDRIAPLFGAAAVASLPPPGSTPEPAPTEPTPAATAAATDPGADPASTAAADPAAVNLSVAPADPAPASAPTMQFEARDDGHPRRRLQIAGMVGGGTMVLIGFLLWGEAGTIQEEVDTHPTATRQQIEDLAALERRGDSFAAWGNVLFLGGAIIGGVSTYYFVKQRNARRAAQTARITPTVFPGGAGFTLTIGGAR